MVGHCRHAFWPAIMAANFSWIYTFTVSIVILCEIILLQPIYGSDVHPQYDVLGDNIDYSRRGLKNVPPDIPNWVKALWLSQNDIDKLEPGVFANLTNLEELELQENKISNLVPGVFAGLTNLKTLDLSRNKIKNGNDTAVWSQVFHHLPNLKTLRLSYNDLTEMPILEAGSNLTNLILPHNKITVISRTSLDRVFLLRELDLSFNKITVISNNTFPLLPKLQELCLKNNRIDKLERGAFNNITNLISLKLFKNRISSLPGDLFAKLTKLKFLDLMRNSLTVLKGLTFKGLTSLLNLNLKKNNIHRLADGTFWGLESLDTLSLDFNNLTSVSKTWVYGLDALECLTLSYNRITDIHVSNFLKALKKLDVSHNRLKEIKQESLQELEKLNTLILSNNQIDYIADGALSGLQALQTLNLNHNKLSFNSEEMHRTLSSLAQLNKLVLDNNDINSIGVDALKGLVNLKQISMSNNPINSIERNAFSHTNKLQELHLNSSSFLCDRSLQWLPAWLSEAGFQETCHASCAHPASVKGVSIFEIRLDQFTPDNYAKPIIVKQPPKSLIALKGHNVTLECEAISTSDSPLNVIWRKNSIALNPEEFVVENFESEGNKTLRVTSRLKVLTVTDKDTGRYQCVVSNDLGMSYSDKAIVTVHVYPTFTNVPNDVTVRAGADARLECAATGSPAPEIAWQKDGGNDFPAARSRRMHFTPEENVYTITNVNSHDQGMYSCTASNVAGTIIANVTITVLETPKLVEPMLDKEVRAGDTAVIECRTQGSPAPTIVWLKDDQPLELNERHFQTGENQLLVIVKTKSSDSGMYKCEMTNSLGKETAEASLKITSPSVFTDNSTTTGIIIIAVVCCVVGTSLIWVIIIYHTRKKNEEYSSTPSDDTTLPGEAGYLTEIRDGAMEPMLSAQLEAYATYPRKIGALNAARTKYSSGPVSSPHQYDIRQYQNSLSVPYQLEEVGGHAAYHADNSEDNSSESRSTNSTQSTRSTGLMSTFHPTLANQRSSNSLCDSDNSATNRQDNNNPAVDNCRNFGGNLNDNNSRLQSPVGSDHTPTDGLLPNGDINHHEHRHMNGDCSHRIENESPIHEGYVNRHSHDISPHHVYNTSHNTGSSTIDCTDPNHNTNDTSVDPTLSSTPHITHHPHTDNKKYQPYINVNVNGHLPQTMVNGHLPQSMVNGHLPQTVIDNEQLQPLNVNGHLPKSVSSEGHTHLPSQHTIANGHIPQQTQHIVNGQVPSISSHVHSPLLAEERTLEVQPQR